MVLSGSSHQTRPRRCRRVLRQRRRGRRRRRRSEGRADARPRDV